MAAKTKYKYSKIPHLNVDYKLIFCDLIGIFTNQNCMKYYKFIMHAIELQGRHPMSKNREDDLKSEKSVQ